MELWFRLNDTLSKGLVITTNEVQTRPGFRGSPFDQVGWSLVVSPNSIHTRLQFMSQAEMMGRRMQNGMLEPLNNDWHHLAVTNDGARVTVWVDGISRLTTTGSALPTIPIRPGRTNGNLSLGNAGHRIPASWCDFDLRQLRISRNVRYTSPFRPPLDFEADATTTSLLDFSDARGSILTDASRNNRPGHLHGATWVTE